MPRRFEAAYAAGLRRKLGLFQERQDDIALAQDLLDRMARNGADFTLTFRRLCRRCSPAQMETRLSAACSPIRPAYDDWAGRWRERLAATARVASERRSAAMRAANPAFIPRNHLVEEALSAAVNNGDLSAFETLLTVLSRPYDDQPDFAALCRATAARSSRTPNLLRHLSTRQRGARSRTFQDS